MKVVEKIKEPIYEEMELFEEKFSKSMKSNVSLLNRITHFIVKRKGKQMRPMFVFLVAKMMGKGKVNERSFRGAAVIELIHTATLVHDDVVDESPKRRGFFSIQALWKKKAAVLVGDYLLSKGLLTAVDAEAFDILKITSRAVREISEGELLQIEKSRSLDITEEVYFDIIRRKTASLIAACCACGAASTDSSEEEVGKMWEFGEKLGLAFQIKDDLLDLGDGTRTGKPTGVDIKEKKLTLPLIHALNESDSGTKKRIIKLVRRAPKDPAAVKEVMEFVLEGPGMEYSRKKMAELRNDAVELLSGFSESPSKAALIDLLDYTIERNK